MALTDEPELLRELVMIRKALDRIAEAAPAIERLAGAVESLSGKGESGKALLRVLDVGRPDRI